MYKKEYMTRRIPPASILHSCPPNGPEQIVAVPVKVINRIKYLP